MELRGSKTEKNLWEAFAGESQARNKYTFFAAKARQDGYEQIGAIFDDTADNERAHAKIWFELLMENGEIPDTLTCLRMATAGENEEHTAMYPRMAAEAKTTRSATRLSPTASRPAGSLRVSMSRSGSAATAGLSISAATHPPNAPSAPIPEAILN